MIHFYGAPASSAGRTHVMLEECGVPYEYHRVNLRDQAQKAEYRKLNAGGKVPFLVDGDLQIPESIAINFYLAEQYAPQLWAADTNERARIFAWSLWGVSTLQAEALRVLNHTLFAPADQRSPYELEHGKKNTQRLLDHLERQLPDAGWLVGARFTVTDINVASAVNLATALDAGKIGPKTTAWMETIKARPAWRKAATEG